MFCSRCGSEVSSNSKFCPSCGLDLTASSPVDTPATGQMTESEVVREALLAEYDVLEEIGRGGMALVYRVRDRQLERDVAVKVLPFALAFDAEFVERFQREARTAAQLEHPNIVPIYRVGRSGRVIFIVMKYLRGGTLSDVLTMRTRLAPAEIRRLLIGTGSALGYAARCGVVHRDIKPDNIMFDEHGHCLLTDFGIAKAAAGHRLTGTGMSIGTPHYMSPEQARAQPTDGRSDLYSLGVVAYQALVGTVPYDGEDSFSIGYKHVTEPLPSPPLVSADDRQLFDVIRRMLMKDPADRFQTADEMVAALEGHPHAALRSAGRWRGEIAVAGSRANLEARLADEPTAPIVAPAIDRRSPQIDRRAVPRRGIDRAGALGLGAMSRAWLWLLLAFGGGGAGALYYYKVRGFAPAATVAQAESVAASIIPSMDTTSVGAVPATLPPLPPVEPITADSGAIRIMTALPAQAMVYIDTLRVTSPVTRVPVGQRIVAVSAPHHSFWSDTIIVHPGETYDIEPRLELRPAAPESVTSPAAP